MNLPTHIPNRGAMVVVLGTPMAPGDLLMKLEEDERFVYWLEKRGRGIFLQSTPIDVAEILGQRLFGNLPSVGSRVDQQPLPGCRCERDGAEGIWVVGEPSLLVGVRPAPVKHELAARIVFDVERHCTDEARVVILRQ